MRARTPRSRLALTAAGMAGLALTLALALAGGPQPLAHSPARAAAQPQCGTSGNLFPWDAAVVSLTPDSGPPGTPLAVGLTGFAPNSQEDQPVEVLWDWDPVSLEGELIGSGTIPRDHTSVAVAAAVPPADPGSHPVTACWLRPSSQVWYYRSAPFEVTEPTPTPSPTPSPTATPTATPTPTPTGTAGTATPTPTPTPTAGQVHNCPRAGKWAIAVWDGPDGIDTAQALDACGEGAVDAAYDLDPDTQNWLRYFPGRPEINTLLTLKNKEGVIAHGIAKPKPLGRIAFTSLRDGNWEIYVMNGDGTGQTNLSKNTAYDYQPAWSPGGSKIAFTSNRDGNWEIYVMNADGTGQTRLTNEPGDDEQPVWSPDGSKIAFVSHRDGNGEIYVMNADGTSQTRLTHNPFGSDHPVWSPDGSKIAWEYGYEIYVMKADGTGVTNLTNNYSAWDTAQAWSPDGSKVVFQSDRDGNWEIYVVNADGTGQTNLTKNPGWDSRPAWSPDGSQIAFESSRGAGDDIYVMKPDGTSQTNLTNSPEHDERPAWSPDSSKIAFASDRNINFEVFVVDANGQTNLTSNPASDEDPVWAPPTPTPKPAVAAKQMHNCPEPGKWAIAVWEGPADIDASDALSTCQEKAVDFAYYLDPDNQQWLRWFAGLPEISNLLTLKNMQGFFARGKATVGPGLGKKIAFASDRDGPWDIYVMNADGTAQTNLTKDPASYWSYRWSPDGAKIAFDSDRDGNDEIYVMNADGTGLTRLTNEPESDHAPAWSPDGSKIAFQSRRAGNWEIYVMNADGTSQSRLTYSSGLEGDPVWSPDGSKIAFDYEGDVCVMNANGAARTCLTTDISLIERYPMWSPDGSKMAYQTYLGYGNEEIYVMNADGTFQTNLTNNPAQDRFAVWSPNGSQIAFVSNRDGNPEIYVMNADGTGLTRLTNNPAEDNEPAWSPDGSKIAFTCERGGNYEVCVIDAKGEKNLTNNPGSDVGPAWSP